jgi:hypothetical protein
MLIFSAARQLRAAVFLTLVVVLSQEAALTALDAPRYACATRVLALVIPREVVRHP